MMIVAGEHCGRHIRDDRQAHQEARLGPRQVWIRDEGGFKYFSSDAIIAFVQDKGRLSQTESEEEEVVDKKKMKDKKKKGVKEDDNRKKKKAKKVRRKISSARAS